VALLTWAGSAQADVMWPADADIFVLGEVHDNPWHHVQQAQIVGDVMPGAIVFEMLTPGQAQIAATLDRRNAEKMAAALDWQSYGWPDFGMYHAIFTAAPDAVIYGADLPGEQLRMAMNRGAVAAFGSEAALYGLSPLSPELQMQREAEQAEAHCNAIPADILPGMVAVQQLRDAHFARVVLQAYAETGGPIVLITGSGHARTDIGVPAALRHARPNLTVWALGQLESADTAMPFEAVNVTGPVERPDPCLAFQ